MNLAQPGQNQALLDQQKATQQIQMQQALGQMSQAGQSSRRTPLAQQMGAQAQAAFGQSQVQAAQKDLQQQSQVAGAIQQEQGQEIQSGLQQRQQASKTRLRSITNQIGALSNNLKQDIFDKQTQFQKDELGRTYWNERQLADWKIKQVKSDEELAEFEQNISQEFEKKMALLQASEKSIRQRLEQEMQKSEQNQDQALMQRLQTAEIELQRKQQKAQARAAQNSAMLGALGTLGGMAIAGGIIAATGGVGAPAAAAIIGASGTAGGAAGGMAAGSGKVKVV
jgi:hypothetical protein